MDDDKESPKWRLHWIAGVALLRDVGHVLVKSDALISAKHKIEVDKLWKEWKDNWQENDIFWLFIEKDRNNVLKTYTLGARLIKDEQGYYIQYKNGEDAFDLFRKAVYWWRHQLMQLEALV